MLYIDQVNRQLQIGEIPQRIISLVPSHTELLVQLGLEAQLVGVTKFCVHPKHLRSSKTIVGGTKRIKIESIKALQPDLILCNKEENTQEIVRACEQIAPVYVSDIVSLASNIEFIQALGKLLSVRTTSQKLVNSITEKQTQFAQFMQTKRQQRVAYFIWRNPWMVAGDATFINELLKLNNFVNAFDHLERYPEINLRDLTELKLDKILLSSEPYPFKEQHEQELKKFSSATIIQVDGEAFSWHGSYLLKAFDYFKSLH